MREISHFILAQAGSVTEGLKVTGGAAGLGSEPQQVGTLVGGLINATLGLLGIVFVILLIYGGILYMTAHGMEDQVKKAKNTLTAAVIGMIIVISAYAITNFIIGQLLNIEAQREAEQILEIVGEAVEESEGN